MNGLIGKVGQMGLPAPVFLGGGKETELIQVAIALSSSTIRIYKQM